MMKSKKLKLFASILALGFLRVCKVEGSLDPLSKARMNYERVRQQIAKMENNKSFFEKTIFLKVAPEQRDGIIQTINERACFSKSAEKDFRRTGDISKKTVKGIISAIGSKLKQYEKDLSDLRKFMEGVKFSQKQEMEIAALMADTQAMAEMMDKRKKREQELMEEIEAQEKMREQRSKEMQEEKVEKFRPKFTELTEAIVALCAKRTGVGLNEFSSRNTSKILRGIARIHAANEPYLVKCIKTAIKILTSPREAHEVLEFYVREVDNNTMLCTLRAITAILTIKKYSEDSELVKIDRIVEYVSEGEGELMIELKDNTSPTGLKILGLEVQEKNPTMDFVCNSIYEVYGMEACFEGYPVVIDTL